MATLDPNAQADAQGAQDAQNAGIAAFLKILADLISGLSNQPVNLEDLTLMSGTKKAWPSDNPDLELTAKIQDAFTNPDSKASVRIFLEYPDGTKDEIFRQTAGKVVKDPMGLAPAMREMFAAQAADKFAANRKPKVVIETDANTIAVDKTTVSSAKGADTAIAQAVSEQLQKTVPNPVTKLEKAELVKDADPAKANQSANPAKDSEVAKAKQNAEPVKDSVKEKMLRGQLGQVEKSLSEATERANAPGFEYLRGQQWFKDLETQAQSLRAQLGVVAPIAAAVAVKSAQKPVEKTEAVTPVTRTTEPAATVQPSIEALKAEPSARERNEQFIMGAIASHQESAANTSPAPIAVQDKPGLVVAQNTKPVVYQDWIPALPELAEVGGALSVYEGQTLNLAPVAAAGPSDIDGAYNNVADSWSASIAPFLAEVSQLSAQIESLRVQTNQKLSELAAFSSDIKESVIEPKLQAFAQQTITTIETQAVTIGDRLRNAASGLVDTVKTRAVADTKIVVDFVQARAAADTEKTVSFIQEKAADAWDATQKWAIGSAEVDRGIDTLIEYVGQTYPNGGIAQMDGYSFVHKNDRHGILKGENLIYKDGKATEHATTKDIAYIAQLPSKAQNAAAAVDAFKATQAKQQSHTQSAGPAMSR